MKTILTTVALGFAISGASTAFAETHTEALQITCAEFKSMELSEKFMLISKISSQIDMQSADDVSLGNIFVLCNGMDNEPVSMLLDARN